MLGWPDADWHLELVHGGAHLVEPRPTEEDLLVLYADDAVPEDLVARLVEHGGKRVQSPNPYWNEWGVTIEDRTTTGWSYAGGAGRTVDGGGCADKESVTAHPSLAVRHFRRTSVATAARGERHAVHHVSCGPRRIHCGTEVS
jgi:hypothetical protein